MALRLTAQRLRGVAAAAALAGFLSAGAFYTEARAPTGTAPASKARTNASLTALFRLAEKGVRKHFPGWRVMPRSSFDPEIVRFMGKRFAAVVGPERCAGDFDGNGRMDAAFIIRKGDRVLYLALNQADPGVWEPHVLSGGVHRGSYKGFSVCLMRRGPGRIRFLSECPEGGGGTLPLKNPGVGICIWEKASDVYYWSDGCYRRRATGD